LPGALAARACTCKLCRAHGQTTKWGVMHTYARTHAHTHTRAHTCHHTPTCPCTWHAFIFMRTPCPCMYAIYAPANCLKCRHLELRWTQAVREQIRKLAVGGPPGKGDNSVYQVSDSEDEDLDEDDTQELTRLVVLPVAQNTALGIFKHACMRALVCMPQHVPAWGLACACVHPLVSDRCACSCMPVQAMRDACRVYTLGLPIAACVGCF